VKKSPCDHQKLDDLTGTPPDSSLKPEARHFKCRTCKVEFFVAHSDEVYHINRVYPNEKRRQRKGNKLDETKRQMQRLDPRIPGTGLCA
jgi:hypothetical protein